ncbi:hypothetical protein C8R44DRAFT_881948 [Mycena epipterygia]|nr:hypothetical protein C8R44DRAFT_881948 [Mycena epipterygia]
MAEDPILLVGPLFIGTILNWALLGALVIQLYNYYSYFRITDRIFVKILVYSVATLEFCQTAFITHVVWQQVISQWGDFTVLATSPWTSSATPVLNGVVSAIVQCFFAWRIWVFEKQAYGLVIAVIVVLIALMQCAAAIAVGVEFSLLSRDLSRIGQLTHAAETWLARSFVCDTIIAVALTIIRSYSKATYSLLNNLIVNTIETGAITAVLALTQLILFEVFPATLLHVALEFIVGRLYANVLLATLNGRHRAKKLNETVNINSIQVQRETEMDVFASGRRPPNSIAGRGVNITTPGASNGSTDEERTKDPYSKVVLC